VKKTSAGRRSVLRSAHRRASGGRVTSRTRGIAVATLAMAPVVPFSPSTALVAALQQLTVLGARLAAGYGIAAKRARDLHVADVGASLSTLHHAVAEELAGVLSSFEMRVPRTKPTCSERLRWEWLASTGRLMSGAPELQVLEECRRIEHEAEEHVVALRDEASAHDLVELSQVVALLQRARAASLRLEPRASNSSIALAFA
jgi:hypothetical protein